ncbi:DUF6443 domain-containing protein [Hymenobacter sp. PAMC 26628]|uniref:DUF6443 domain-containing protein n=1 Tax=Hymenobacter sp. PAMC 26628 TaxID=1484118 RepID=UPI00076FF1F5|nr:DUF6443 domain-containing protein [Hymenobacter sp. PAMC 26628]AMJ64047.1 hypothetical protein AXW84_00330 [Hymenobacter sp. PAMC 26628]
MRWTSIVAHARFYGALLLALLLLLVAEGARAQAVPAGQGLVADSTELRVLRQLYAATGGDGWTHRDNWLQGTTLADAASWWGVTVGGGDVVGFYSDNNNLQGTLPAALGQLAGLTQLQFSTCIGLTGTMPREIGQLTRLQRLIFHFTGLSGPLPAELGNLVNLTYLSLYTNRFSGALPPELGRLAQLQVLYLGTDVSIPPGGGPQDRGNRFTGGVPKEWGQLTNLRVLELDTAPLGGAVPPELGQLVHLAELTFDTNGFTGPVPAELLNLPALTYLTLGYNVTKPPAGYGVLNGLTGLPAAAAVRNPGQLRLSVQKNYLDFGALEPYFTGPGAHVFAALDYRAQRPPAGADTVRFVPGQALTLRRPLGGARTHYQWQRLVGGAWQDVPGAQADALTLVAPSAADAGAYRVTGTNDFVTNLTLTSKLLYVQVDRAPALTNPPLTAACPVPAPPAAPADRAGAQDLVNYVRTWAPRVPLTAPDATPPPAPAGTLLREQWDGVAGTGVVDVPVNAPPTRTAVLSAFEAAPADSYDYGARFRGYVTAPQAGDYTFWVAADDTGQLWLSPDEDPAHKALVAAAPGYTAPREWDKFPAQQSDPIRLEAGQRYYIEALHKQAGGGGHLSVRWQRPDGTFEEPLGGNRLTAFDPAAPAPAAAPTPVANGGFEAAGAGSNALVGWQTAYGAGSPTDAAYRDDFPDAHTGDFHATHYQNQAYEADTYQVVTGLANGLYTLRAWVQTVGGQDAAFLQAQGYGGPLVQAAITATPGGVGGDWVRVEVPNIAVTNGQCRVGVFSRGPGGAALYFDDVALVAQPNALANASFETGEGNALAGWQTAYGAGSPTDAAYRETYPDGRTGDYHATHYQSQPYQAYTYQVVTGLPAGTYRLRAWVKTAGGQDAAYLQARDYGGPPRQTPIAATPGGADGRWQPVEVAGIAVTGGRCEVGVFSRGPGGTSLYFDDVELLPQPGTAAPDPAWTVDQAAATTTYLDGLGRPVQTVQWQASPQKHDLVQAVAYDALGRQPRQYLPYAFADTSHQVGAYRPNALREQFDFYTPQQPQGPGLLTEGVARTGQAYGETQFEASPLNRVLAQGAPGAPWAVDGDHAAHRTERPNTAADAVARFAAAYSTDAAAAHALAYQGDYPAGELWVTETTDEQQNPTRTFADKQGQVVAKQVGLGAGQWLTTGYVYDDFQRLRAVLPPKATKLLAGNGQQVSAAVDSLLFYYRYDGRGRPLAKQVPGQAGEVLTVFDQLDRPVLSQDPAQRARNEWSWVKYDALGRAVLTGLVTRTATADALQQQADQLGTAAAGQAPAVAQFEQPTPAEATQYYSVTGAYPRLGQDGFGAGRVLTATYYDGYDFNRDGAPDLAFDNQYAGQFPAGQAPAADGRVTGLATRTQTRVLGVADGDATQAAWLTTTTFYDDKARPVQVVATNARKGGQDVVTSQVDFVGQVLKSYAVHTDPRHEAIGVAETHTYDHAGRLLTTAQQLPGEAQPATVASLAYNELGQVLQKQLAPGTGLAQAVDYAYNIRGWLTGLNEDLVSGTTPAAASKDLWGMTLSYDCGFQSQLYNGNISGQKWRNKHDGVARAYGYGYDGANRLLYGDYVAQDGAGNWNAEQQRFALAGVRYDENGNILALQRRGLLQNATHTAAKQFGPVDDLNYAYAGNRLQAVNDGVGSNQLARPTGYHGAPASLAGDFQEAGVRQAQEYAYDPNGSLSSDANKGISGILYNHLSLPRQIHFGTGADSVVFRYTAAGQKVAKLVYQSGKPTVRTDYLGPYQYEGDSLRFFPHAEGRVLRFVNALSGQVRYEREYTLKDHLGNLRLAYRLGHRQTFTATLEPDEATRQREVHQFDSLSVSPPVAQPVGGQARTGSYVARLNAGGSAPQPLGPLTQLAVQKGDTVTVTAPGYYPQAVPSSSFSFSLAGFVAGLLQQQPAGAPGADGRRRGALPLLSLGVSAPLAALARTSGVPQGYVRLLVFDADSNLVSSQVRTQQLSAAANGGYEPLTVQVVAGQDGYVTAYVGNESNADVYFDDVQVVLGQGLQVQETEYDPAGLELAGLVAPSPGIRGLNNYRFNGQEFQADLGLNWNHQDWRFFNPQIFTWSVVDPEVENGQESWTPYSFGYDNAIRYADANGRWPDGGGGAAAVAVPVLIAAAEIAGEAIAVGAAVVASPVVLTVAAVAVGVVAIGYGATVLADHLPALSPGFRVSNPQSVFFNALYQSTHSASSNASNANTGVIYKRTNPQTGEKYVGQAKSDERFTKRQKEHDKAKGVRHDYETLERAASGKDLDVAEEKHIRAEGGPKTKSNPNGELENKRHQMSDERYKKATSGN